MSWVDYSSFFSVWLGCGSSSFIVLGALWFFFYSVLRGLRLVDLLLLLSIMCIDSVNAQ